MNMLVCHLAHCQNKGVVPLLLHASGKAGEIESHGKRNLEVKTERENNEKKLR